MMKHRLGNIVCIVSRAILRTIFVMVAFALILAFLTLPFQGFAAAVDVIVSIAVLAGIVLIGFAIADALYLYFFHGSRRLKLYLRYWIYIFVAYGLYTWYCLEFAEPNAYEIINSMALVFCVAGITNAVILKRVMDKSVEV